MSSNHAPAPAAKVPAKPAASQPPPARQSARGSRRLWGALVIVLLLLLGLSGYLAFGTQTGTASIAAQNFCAALVAHDYTHAYAQLSARLRGEGTATQFAASQQALDRLRGPARACSFSNPRIHAGTASFSLTVARAGSGSASGALLLVYEGGQWRVDDYDANVL